jgi:hypothetical protein
MLSVVFSLLLFKTLVRLFCPGNFESALDDILLYYYYGVFEFINSLSLDFFAFVLLTFEPSRDFPAQG